jgi:hypothetical protein
MTTPRLEFLSPSYGLSLGDLQKENEVLKDQLAESESKNNRAMWGEFLVGMILGLVLGVIVAVTFAICLAKD